MFVDAERPVLQVTGLNHQTAQIDLRERFAVTESDQDGVLAKVLSLDGVDEAVVINTCNRVELFVSTHPAATKENISSGLEQVLAGVSGVGRSLFSDRLYHLREKSAVTHLFRVASGLDSLVLGEPQVLGQLKDAYEFASKMGAARGVLHRLFHRAFSVAKTVRSHTAISRNAVSVCFAAKELAQQIFGDLSEASIMLVGAGETGALAVKHFAAAGAHRFVILNKTISRAGQLASKFAGVAGGLDRIAEYLPQSDIIIAAAALGVGDEPLVSSAMVQQSLKQRGGRPQFFLDLAVPRNVSPKVEDISDAFLYNIDDLETIVEQNMSARQIEASRAEVIISQEVDRFWSWFETLPAEAMIRELVGRCEDFRGREIEKTIRRLERSGEFQDGHLLREALEDLTQALVAKTLHSPLTALKRKAAEDPDILDVFRELFFGPGRPPGGNPEE